MKTRKLSEILTRMIDKVMIGTDRVTDFSPGSAIRSLLEAVSLEIEQFYILTKENIEWGIAEGTTEAFDFERKKNRKAYGDVTLRMYNPLEQRYYIPRGTIFTSSNNQFNQQYETLVDYYIEQGSTEAQIEVYCLEAGTYGNIPEHIIDSMSSASSVIKEVDNETSFNTGQDLESLEDLKERFHLFIKSRGRATNKAIQYGALSVPDVEGVYVYEQVGRVLVYAHDHNGNLSNIMIQEIYENIEDYRPSGIKLDVQPVDKISADVNVDVEITNKQRINDTLKEHIENFIRNYLNDFTVNKDLILADLTQVIMNIDDSLIYDLTYNINHENIITEPHEIIRSGEINVTLK